MAMRPERIGLSVTLGLHVLAAVLLLSYEPARKALLTAAPIMVELIAPPKSEAAKPAPPTELPKPKPVVKRVERTVELPVRATPAEAPSPVVAPPPPPPAPAPVAAPAPALVTQPIFNADYLDNPAPAYPSVSRRAGEQGRVVLRVLVSAAGRADEVQVRTSSGFARLDDAARETVQRWKFVSAKRGAEPIAAWVLIPISFRLER
jgi:protein TonB